MDTDLPAPRSEAAAKALRALPFTAHNLDLGHGRTTLDPTEKPLLRDLTMTHAVKDFLQLAGMDRKRAEYRLLDLGCLEGGFALEFAHYGFKESVGVEGRAHNYEICARVADYFALPNLRYLHLDARDVTPETHGLFDVILHFGLLYHLDDPLAHLDQIARLVPDHGMLFLNTHFAPRNDTEAAEYIFADRYRGQPLVTVEEGGETYEGRWWDEFPEGTPDDQQHPWSSVHNHRSFVLTYHSLTKALLHRGFRYLYRLPFGDVLWEANDGYRRYRTWLVALKNLPRHDD